MNEITTTLRAPAKLNLGLRVGRADGSGLHQIRSLFCPLVLADRITVAEAEADEVICPGVEGENLAERALAALRERGWRAAPMRITIEKQIPVAAGLGGGSADAAAVLRLARGSVPGLDEIALGLGADVPSQLAPAPAVVGGVGERIDPISLGSATGVVLIPFQRGLEAAEVYARFDELGGGAGEGELDRWEAALRERAPQGALALGELLANDLERAAMELMPPIGAAIEALSDAGAAAAFVCGSGPTVAGLFEDVVAADSEASSLAAGYSNALVTALEVA